MSALAALWLRPGVRSVVWQALAAAAVLGAVPWIGGNIAGNVARRGRAVDFGLLAGRASFEFGENPVGYRAGDRFLTAFPAGLANTLLVAVLGIVLTTIIATMLALARLSPNRLLAHLAWSWIEAVRNTPLMLQLLFWHRLAIRALPGPREAWQLLPATHLSNRGLVFAGLVWQPAKGLALAGFVACVLAAVVLRRLALARGPGTGLRVAAPLVLALTPPLLLLSALAPPIAASVPALRGFNVRGGIAVSPEFVALLVALLACQAGFMVETIRSGILGVPPVTSQYLSLTRNSLLAVALWDRAVARGVWQAETAEQCARAGGMCWAFLADRWRPILFGPYPDAEQWRPALAKGLFALLFLASVLFPYLVLPGWSMDVLARAQIAFALFFAADMAEAIRGGLQAIPRGQHAAAESLGLTYWQMQRRIILPQALRTVIPSLVNILIAAFKDTSLVVVISMIDLLGAADASTAEAKWWGPSIEPYLFVVLIYLAICAVMSACSRGLERRLGVGRERIAVCGPSGSGKSTLVSCINGLVDHNAGGSSSTASRSAAQPRHCRRCAGAWRRWSSSSTCSGTSPRSGTARSGRSSRSA